MWPGTPRHRLADPLEKEQRKDVLLIIAGIDRAAQGGRRSPQIFFQFLLGHVRFTFTTEYTEYTEKEHERL